jgi:predicted Zn-dependent protease
VWGKKGVTGARAGARVKDGRARECGANLGIGRGSEGWRDVREVASERRGRGWGHGACGRPHCILKM